MAIFNSYVKLPEGRIVIGVVFTPRCMVATLRIGAWCDSGYQRRLHLENEGLHEKRIVFFLNICGVPKI